MCDRPQAFRAVTRKARKEHVCCECGAFIEVGDEYEYVSGIWNDTAASFKTCESCATVRQALEPHTCEGIAFGEVEYMVQEYLWIDSEDKLEAAAEKLALPKEQLRKYCVKEY